MKLLIVGDIHLRGDSPRGRIGNYYEDCKEKLQEVFDLAEEYQVDRILQVGDLFNSPTVSFSLLADFMLFLAKQKRKLYCIPGNHDMYAHNPDTLHRTAFGLLQALGYIEELLWYKDSAIEIIGSGFRYTLDKDYSEYATPEHPGRVQILVIHGMLLEKSPGFEMRHSTIDKAAKVTDADIIVSGHYHLPFNVGINKKIFINPGALMRMSATTEEINRIPQVAVISTQLGEYSSKLFKNDFAVGLVDLKSAKPGNEVLNREHIEKQELRNENMQRFIESLDITSEARYMDIQAIIEKCAGNYNEKVVEEALKRISKVRMEKND